MLEALADLLGHSFVVLGVFIVPLGVEPDHKPQRIVPQGVYLDGFAVSRRKGGSVVLGVH